MAAVTWEDFFKPKFLQIGAKRQAKFIKLIAVAYGTMCVLVAFLAKPLGGIVKCLLSAIGATAGPLVGLFLLGLCCPRANSRGAFIGLGVSVGITMWISVGNAIYKPYANYALPMPSQNCSQYEWAANATVNVPARNSSSPYSPLTGFSSIYGISDIMYSSIGILLVIFVGWPASLLFGKQEEKKGRGDLTLMGLRREYLPVNTTATVPGKSFEEDEMIETAPQLITTTTVALHA